MASQFSETQYCSTLNWRTAVVQDPDLTELSKLLEMKGLRRNEQGAYLEQFRDTYQVHIVVYLDTFPFNPSILGYCIT